MLYAVGPLCQIHKEKMYLNFSETKGAVFTDMVINLEPFVSPSLNQRCMAAASKFAQVFPVLKLQTKDKWFSCFSWDLKLLYVRSSFTTTRNQAACNHLTPADFYHDVNNIQIFQSKT